MNKKIKIALFVPTHWSVRFGGAQYQVKLLHENLDNSKFDTYIMSKYTNSSSAMSVNFLPVLAKRINSVCLFKYLSAVRRIKPDILYQRVGGPFTGMNAIAGKVYNIPTVWHVAHIDDVKKKKSNFNPLKMLDSSLFEYGIRNNDYIIVQTKDQQDELYRNYSKTADLLLYNFQPPPIEECKKNEKFTVVFVSNLKPIKRPDLFVDLANMFVGQQHIDFVMIGDSYDNSPWTRRLLERCRQSNVKYLGKLDIDHVNSVLAESSVFVSTSKSEGFPNTFIQAWARSTPVVSLDVDPDDVISRFDCGILCKSLEEMKNVICSLACDRELYRALSTNSKRYYDEFHSMKNIKIFEDFIEGIV